VQARDLAIRKTNVNPSDRAPPNPDLATYRTLSGRFHHNRDGSREFNDQDDPSDTQSDEQQASIRPRSRRE
jgi:hypothetical protein